MTTREQIEQEIKQRQEWLAVLADIEAGHQIQARRGYGPWFDIVGAPDIAQFNCLTNKFRRKPEPLRGWVNLYPPEKLSDDCIYLQGGEIYKTKELAEKAVDGTKNCIGQAEFVQVL